jgi:hypothetical protein
LEGEERGFGIRARTRETPDAFGKKNSERPYYLRLAVQDHHGPNDEHPHLHALRLPDREFDLPAKQARDHGTFAVGLEKNIITNAARCAARKRRCSYQLL